MAEIGGAVETHALILCGMCWLLPVVASLHFPVSDLDTLLTWIAQPMGGVLILAGVVQTYREW